MPRADMTPPETHDARHTLRRELGIWEVTAGGIGIIIGAGIYVLIGAATEQAGATVWLAFVLAAVLSALTGLSYAELVSMFPRASAEYEYTRQAFPEWVAFLAGWVMTAALIIAAATISLGFARYAGQFVPVSVRVGGVALLFVVGGIAARGIKASARVTLVLSLVQISGLLLVITVGAPHIGDVNLLEGKGAGGVLAAAALVFFAFIGFDEVNTLAEETRNPVRTVPRALFLALGISTALYVSVAIAAVSVLGAEALGRSERPLAEVLTSAVGARGADLVTVIALISTTNTTLLAITAASRMLFGMASSGALPRMLSVVDTRTGAPARALLTATVLAAGFALLGNLTLVASVTDFAIYLVFIAVHLTLIVLRLRRPELARPFRVPGRLGRLPLIPLVGLASVLLMMTQLERGAVLIGLGVCAAGLVAGRLLRARAAR